jgi:hypothetical protein
MQVILFEWRTFCSNVCHFVWIQDILFECRTFCSNVGNFVQIQDILFECRPLHLGTIIGRLPQFCSNTCHRNIVLTFAIAILFECRPLYCNIVPFSAIVISNTAILFDHHPLNIFQNSASQYCSNIGHRNIIRISPIVVERRLSQYCSTSSFSS